MKEAAKDVVYAVGVAIAAVLAFLAVFYKAFDLGNNKYSA